MANSLITVPNVLDTAATVISAAQKYTARKMLWQPAADGDSITLKRADGSIYFTLTAVVAQGPFWIEGPIRLDDGLEIVGANPGVLYIWKE